jgi:hypothetical protein
MHRLLALVVSAAAASSVQASPSLRVDGTELIVTTDGRSYKGVDLVGSTIRVSIGGDAVDITITAVEKDEAAALFLYRFVTKDAHGNLAALCKPDAAGKTLGFPVSDGRGGFELACTGSAVGKCVRWGYRPWDEVPKGPPLRALHTACVHMLRADYGGDGHPTATGGTVVHVCDRFGVKPCGKDAPLVFEAAWGERGATCVARPRARATVKLEELGRRYSNLKRRLGSRACTARTAFSDPRALLLNRSL